MARSEQPRYLNGEALKHERAKAGLEQAELGARVGASQSQVSGWERGYNGCRLGTLHKLAEALGIPPQRLMRDPSASTPGTRETADADEEPEAA